VKQLANVCFALVVCLALNAAAYAQVNAILGGTVSDQSGAVIPGATLTVTNVNTGIVTTRTANETGNYEFPALQPGTYTLTASYQGFQTMTYTNVILGQGQQVRQNVVLQVAAAAQTVEVTAEADTTLGTTAASIGSVLTDRAVQALPVLNRNVLDLISTSPGVITTRTAFAEVPIFSGTGQGQVNTTRDGLITNDGRYNDSNGAYSGVFTSPDMVEEMRISTNTIDPAVGRGSGQVQLRTRAGGNQFHGALFYTNNNSALTAFPFFDKLTGAPKSYQNRNQYGGRLGGPIWRNKAFFFVLVDNQRYLEKQLVTSTVLTEPARNGIFRYLTAGAPGGTTRRNGNAFAVTPSVDINGNIRTVAENGQPLFLNSFNVFTDVRDPNRSRIDPVWFSSQYLKRMPLPNNWTVGDGLNTAGYQWLRRHEGLDGSTGVSANPNRDHLTTRFDYQASDSHKLTFTMSREVDKSVNAQTGLPAYPDGYFGDLVRTPRFYTVQHTWVISPTVLNEFRVGYKNDTWLGTSPMDRGCCWNGRKETDRDKTAQEAYDSFPKTPDGKSLVNVTPGLGLGSYAPLGVSTPRSTISPLKQIADTVTINKGAHSFQVGVEANYFISEGINSGGQDTTRPTVVLGIGNVQVPNITATNFPGLNALDIPTAQGLLAQLAGTVASVNEQFFVNSPKATDWLDYRDTFLFRRKHHQNDWAVFFKDSWKVTRNLTLNFGLRYDKYGTPYDSLGLGGRFTGGQSGLFGISGTNFANALWAPGVANGSPTTTEFVGKHSPQPDKLIFGNDWNNLAPSFGFAYNVPWFSRPTVIRGGYGWNYAGAVDFLSYSSNIANLPGFNLNVRYASPTYLDLSGLNAANVLPVPRGGTRPFEPVPIYSSTGRTANITGYADDRVVPYIQNFNLSVQREVARNLTVEVSWVGNKATKLWGNTQINETNIFENGLLEAFNTIRAGGESQLLNQMLMGINIAGVGTVNGTTLTGSEALRRFNTTNQFIANGDVGAFANFLNTNTTGTGIAGGLIQRAGLPANFIVANPQFASVSLAGNTANSTYHSLQVAVTQRYARNFQGQFSYVFSKTLGLNAMRHPRDWSLSKGISGLNRTHVLKFNGAWDIPFDSLWRGAPQWANHLIGGWQLAPNIQWTSGSPLSFTTTRGSMGFRANGTPDLVNGFKPGKVVVGNAVVNYFADLTVQQAPLPNFGGSTVLRDRFTNQVVLDRQGRVVAQNPEPGRVGTAPQNQPGLDGPAQLGFDLSLSKRITIREAMSFTVRADALDILNKPQWGNPNMDINSQNFGRITQAAGNRTVTLTARFDF
jgi:hypothetical protein